MASIDSRGLVDDGTQNLTVAGTVAVNGSITSSAGSFAVLSTINNGQNGQNLGSPNSFVQVLQWLTGAMSSPGATPVPTGSININQDGMYLTTVSMSFSGSVGTYTFSLFQNGVQHPNCQLQTNLPSAQPFPIAVTLQDYNAYKAGDVLDVRVKCTNAGANFQLGNGNFIVLRTVG